MDKLHKLLEEVFKEYGDFILISPEQLIVSQATDRKMKKKLREKESIIIYHYKKEMLAYNYYFENFSKRQKIIWLFHELIHIFVFSDIVRDYENFVNIKLLNNGNKQIDSVKEPRNFKISQFRCLMLNFDEFIADTYIYAKNKELFNERMSLLYKIYEGELEDGISNYPNNIDFNKLNFNKYVFNLFTLISSYHKFIQNRINGDLETKYYRLKGRICGHIITSERFPNPDYLIKNFEDVVYCYINYDENELEKKFYELIDDKKVVYPS